MLRHLHVFPQKFYPDKQEGFSVIAVHFALGVPKAAHREYYVKLPHLCKECMQHTDRIFIGPWVRTCPMQCAYQHYLRFRHVLQAVRLLEDKYRVCEALAKHAFRFSWPNSCVETVSFAFFWCAWEPHFSDV